MTCSTRPGVSFVAAGTHYSRVPTTLERTCMLLAPSSEQTFFQETTARFLDERAQVAKLRRLRHDPLGFDADDWRQGAELGWTSLLVAERDGGVSVSSSGLVDLTLVAYEFGRHAAPGPLVSSNVVASALSHAGAHKPLIGQLLDGSAIGAWCLAERSPHDGLADVRLDIAADGGELVLNGVKRPVESADRASHLLVTGRTGAGLTQLVIPANAR